MSPVTVDNATLVAGGRAGGAGYMLNVNAGSKVGPTSVSPFATYVGISEMLDMCMFGGDLHVVHAELDSAMPIFGGQKYQMRGPYVQKWDGASWSMLGGAIDPATDAVPGIGDRCLAIEPRIATDGSNLFVAYFDTVATNITSGSGTGIPWLRIARWNGGSWDEMASFQTHGPMSMVVVGGVAHCVVAAPSPVNIGLGTDTVILVARSDGSFDYLLYSYGSTGAPYVALADGTSIPAAAVSSTGRPVGFYTQDIIGGAASKLVMFDMGTMAVIRVSQHTGGVSPFIPCSTSAPVISLGLGGEAASYENGSHFLLRGDDSYFIVPQDGSGDFVVLDGAQVLIPHGFPTLAPGGPAVDPADPNGRLFWFAVTAVFFDGTHVIYDWEQNCGGVFGCEGINAPPYAPAQAGGYVVPPFDGFVLSNQELLGPSRFVVDGDILYVGFMYYPFFEGISPPNTQPYWTQFGVAQFTIQRSTTDCATLAVFTSRHNLQN